LSIGILIFFIKCLLELPESIALIIHCLLALAEIKLQYVIEYALGSGIIQQL